MSRQRIRDERVDITLVHLMFHFLLTFPPATDQILPRSSQILRFERKSELDFQFRQRIRDERVDITLGSPAAEVCVRPARPPATAQILRQAAENAAKMAF